MLSGMRCDPNGIRMSAAIEDDGVLPAPAA